MPLRPIVGKSVLLPGNVVQSYRRPADLPALAVTCVPLPPEVAGYPYLEVLECGHQIAPKRDRMGIIVEPSIGRKCVHCDNHEPPHIQALD